MAEKLDNKKKAAVELYFSRNQTNGLIYVLDCFVKADKTNKYGKYAAALKKAITNYSRVFVSDGEEMIAFHLCCKERRYISHCCFLLIGRICLLHRVVAFCFSSHMNYLFQYLVI